MRSNEEMPGRETTIPTIPSDTATFDEEPGAAKAVLRRDSKPTCLTFDGTREVLRAMRSLPMISSKSASLGLSRSFISGELGRI
jgi:hypothetical protein